MKKLRTVIVQSQVHNINRLNQLLLDYCPDMVVVIGTSLTIQGALDFLKEDQTDLLFLDVELPDGTAFDLLELLEERGSSVILTDGDDRYALKAIKYGITDYLLKPVDAYELERAVKKIAARQLQLHEDKGTIDLSGELLVYTRTSIEKVPLKDIEYLEADGIYTWIYFRGKSLLSSRPVGFYETMLVSPIFFRCHKSYIVNKYYIRSVNKHGRGLLLVLFSKLEIAVSVRKKEAFTAWYNA